MTKKKKTEPEFFDISYIMPELKKNRRNTKRSIILDIKLETGETVTGFLSEYPNRDGEIETRFFGHDGRILYNVLAWKDHI
jgi:hypothetical protein